MTSDTASQIAYLARALKAPALRDSAGRLAATARDSGWTHQEYLAACLEAEVATRSAHGAENRIRRMPNTCATQGRQRRSRWSRHCGGGSVKPSATPSVVRIHHLPPPAETAR